MNSIILITISFGIENTFNIAAKNEPNKIQITDLIREVAKQSGKEGTIFYEKYHAMGGTHKIYMFRVDKKPVVAEVRRMPLVEFEK